MPKMHFPEFNKARILEALNAEVGGLEAEVAVEDLSAHAAEEVDRVALPKKAAAPFLEQKEVYHLQDFLRYHDEEYVINAYRGVLKRYADQEGCAHYLRKLRKAEFNKIGILGRLRYSREGRGKGVRIKGLLPRYVLNRISSLSIVGAPFRYVNALLRLPTRLRQLEEFNNFTSARFQENNHWLNGLSSHIENHLEQINKLLAAKASSEDVERCLTEQEDDTRQALAALGEMNTELREWVDEALNAKVTKELFEQRLAGVAKHNDKHFASFDVKLDGAVDELHILLREKASHEALESGLEALSKAERLERDELKAQFEEVQLSLNERFDQKASKSELKSQIKHISKDLQERLHKTEQAFSDNLAEELSTLEGRLNELGASTQNLLEESSSEFSAQINALKASLEEFVEQKRREMTAALENLSEEFAQGFTRLDSGLRQKVDKREVEQVSSRLDQKLDVDTFEELHEALCTGLASMEADLKKGAEALSERLKSGTQKLKGLEDELLEVTKASVARDEFSSQIQRLDSEKAAKSEMSTLNLSLAEVKSDLALELTSEHADFYQKFEDEFRGSREQILERLHVYAPLFESFDEQDPLVVDFGCGRGEWLELLKSWQIRSYGVDISQAAIEQCRARDLDAVCEDVVAHLKNMEPESVLAATSFHLIEHVPLGKLLTVMDELYRVIRPGGFVLLETPNPENVLVGSCNFYLDPTHRNPMPPKLTKFLLEYAGFKDVVVEGRNPAESSRVEESGDLAGRFNHYFYDFMDYSVVGRRE